MKAVIALGGRLRGPDWLRGRLDADIIIGADSGCDNLRTLGCLPDYALGDFDSISREGLDWLKRNRIERTVYPERKNATDAELSIDFALSRGCDDLFVLSGFSHRRPDHNLATLLLLASLLQTGRIQRGWLTNGETLATALIPGRDLQVQLSDMPSTNGHRIVSILALTEMVEGLDYEGLAYPLTDFTLPFGSTRAISNSPEDGVESFRLRSSKGLALVYVTPEHKTADDL